MNPATTTKPPATAVAAAWTQPGQGLPTGPTEGARPASWPGALIRSLHAEAIKLSRPRILAVTTALIGLTGIGATALMVVLAKPAVGPQELGGALSTQDLSAAGGGTAVAVQTLSYASVFLLAAFIAAVAGEFTRGTFRTLLLQQPRRGPLLAGRLTALVGFAGAATLVGAVLSWGTARLLAPSQGIDVSAWTTWAAGRAAAEGLGRALLTLSVIALFGAAVGVLTRSVPVGVGAGLVWAGPLENIIGGSWTPAQRYFPMLLTRAVLNPGSTAVSSGRALITLGVYVAIALTVIVVAIRRDVTT